MISTLRVRLAKKHKIRSILHDFRYEIYSSILHQLLLTSGEEDLRTVVTNIIRVGFRDHNPLVIEWIVRICGQHLREVVDGLHVIHEELNSFVVASGAEGTPNKAANANVAKLKAEDEPMEAEDTASMEEEECWSEAKESLEEEKPGTKGGWKRLFLSHFGKLLLECRRYVKYNLITYTCL